MLLGLFLVIKVTRKPLSFPVALDEYFFCRAFGEQQEEESNSVGGDSLGGALAEYNMQVCKELINA